MCVHGRFQLHMVRNASPSSSTFGPTLPGNFNGSAVFSLPYLSLVPNFLSLIPSDFISMKAAVLLSPPQNFSKACLTVWPYGAPPKVLSAMGRGRSQKDSWQPQAITHPCPPSTTPPLLSCPTSREFITAAWQWYRCLLSPLKAE